MMDEKQILRQTKRFGPRAISLIGAIATSLLCLFFVLVWPKDLVGVIIACGVLMLFVVYRGRQACPECGQSLLQRRIRIVGRDIWVFHPVISKECGNCNSPL